MADVSNGNHGGVIAETRPAIDFAKTAAAIVGSFYGLGFLVVTIHLSRYHVLPFGLLRLQYLLAGIWLVLPLISVALPCLWAGAVMYDGYHERPAVERGCLRTLFDHGKIAGLAFFLSFGWLFVMVSFISIAAPELFTQLGEVDFVFAARYSVSAFVFALVLAALAYAATRLVARVQWTDIKRSASDILKTIIVCSFMFVVTFAYIAHFALNVYPRLPAVIGGGAPVRVMILMDAANALVSSNLGKAGGPVYDLLLETEKTYVLLARNPSDAVVVVVNKDIVNAVVISATGRQEQ